MENAKSTSYFGIVFGREGSSPFSCTAVILVILYIQEWRGMGCRLEKVSWCAIQTANVCNCVKHTLPTGMENGRENYGNKLEEVSYIVGHSNC